MSRGVVVITHRELINSEGQGAGATTIARMNGSRPRLDVRRVREELGHDKRPWLRGGEEEEIN
jgi:hypothetical protein